MKPRTNFSVTEHGTCWPSGSFAEVAMIDASYKEVQDLVASDLIEGVEEGMGSWKAIGIRLDAGEVIELIRYSHDPDQAFTLRVDSMVDFSAALEKVLVLLGKNVESLRWVSPLVDENVVRRSLAAVSRNE